MTCEDCKFYQNECEAHSQLESIGMKHDMKVCENLCPNCGAKMDGGGEGD